ncbi:MAG: sulfatase [Synoicihabitans sp.]
MAFLLLIGSSLLSAADTRPNIVWVIPDDMSAHFSSYGETAIETPHLDRMVDEGLKFTRAFVTAPVCSTCRSAFITGMYQTAIGAHNHRSGRGELKIELPEHIKLIPQIFQEAGYYTSVGRWPADPAKRGKTDYNFEWDQSVYDSGDWAGRAPGQPFFAQIQTPGGKLRGSHPDAWQKIGDRAEKELGSRTQPSQVTLPPYYPDHPHIRQDWAAYLDSVRLTDAMLGEVLARLNKEGVLENTLVIFMTDHGISHARGKQFMYDEGLHVPFVVRGPGVTAGTVREDLIEHIDIAALSLGAAGIDIPDYMQARDILADDYAPRDAAFAARDRCDETVDHMRSVRTERYKYIRNYLPRRPYLQPNAYKDAKAIIIAMRDWHAQGRLDAAQSLIMAESRPPEELYDLVNDPYEIHNLATDPAHAATLATLRGRLDSWVFTSNDLGREMESVAMFESDMKVQLDKRTSASARNNTTDTFPANLDLMRKWRAEGK